MRGSLDQRFVLNDSGYFVYERTADLGTLVKLFIFGAMVWNAQMYLTEVFI